MAALGFPFDPATVARPCTYADLPDVPAIQRLKSRRQWVCWRYEDRGGAKPTKVPYQPATGFKASTSNPAHWGTYDQAVARAQRGRFDGIGFVLSDDDDLTGIDLDHCRDPNTGELEPLAQQIVDLAETYCEVTPSEAGLRIIAEGKIAAALKRDAVGVELYGRGRYLTITGWHLPGTPTDVRPAERTVEILREAVARYDAENAPKPDPHALVAVGRVAALPAAREEGGSPFFRNVNGAALDALHTWVPAVFGAAARFQPGTGAFRVSSRSLGRNLQEDLSIAPNGIRDWGVGDMGDARQGARTPIDLVIEYGFERDPLAAARWLCQQMGKDPESYGWEEGSAQGAEIAAALLARQVVTAPTGELVDAETGEFIVPARVKADATKDYPDDALQVPGLIGEMADWIMATAMFPCRLFAVSAALAAVGTVIGRQCYTGVPRAGSALYWLAIAPTAGGKDRPQEAVKQMFAAAGLGHLIKPSVSSSAKLGMSLHEQPVQCQVIDEVGKVLRKFVSRNASAQEMALLDDYCSVWGKNLGSFEPEGVTTRGDTSIRQPSLTFFGATTPTNFYTQLRSAQVAGGFLNRFLVMQRHVRVPENPNVQPEEVIPPHFIEALQTLRTWQDARIMPAPGNMADDAERPPAPFVVPMTPEAEAMLGEARMRARAMILASDEDPVLEVYARSAEMVKRMALVLACGRHWRNMPACRIEVQDVTFAANLVDWSMASFVEGLRQHMAENEHQANAKMVLSMVRKAGKMTRNELVRRVDGRLDARTLDNVMRSLVEGGTVEQCTEAASAKGGRPRTTYVYRGTCNLLPG
jgi:Protein of unknown function (DUF3987)